MSKILITAATIIVLGLAVTGTADARGGGGHGGFGGGFGGGHIGAVGGAHIGGFGGGHIGGFGGARLGGMGAAHLGRLGAGTTRMGDLGAGLGGHARLAHDYGRRDLRFHGDWGYAASCAIYEPYYRPWCAGDADSGILSPDAVY
jgi:hypothetical protein